MNVKDYTISLLAVYFSNGVPMSNFSTVPVCSHSVSARGDLVGHLRRKDSADGTVLVQDS